MSDKQEQDKNNETKPLVTEDKGMVVENLNEFITEYDIYLFREGKHFSLHDKLGAHVIEHKGTRGTFFAVWAPNAASVTVIGNFNGWMKDANHR